MQQHLFRTGYGHIVFDCVPSLSVDVIMIIVDYARDSLPNGLYEHLMSAIHVLDPVAWIDRNKRTWSFRWVDEVVYRSPCRIIRLDNGDWVLTDEWRRELGIAEKDPPWARLERDHEGTKQRLWRAVVLERMHNKAQEKRKQIEEHKKRKRNG